MDPRELHNDQSHEEPQQQSVGIYMQRSTMITGIFVWFLLILGCQIWYTLRLLGIELRFGMTMFVYMTSSGDNAGTYVIGCNTALYMLMR